MSLSVPTERAKRGVRFARVQAPAFKLTARDRDILAAVAQFGVIQSSHVDALFAGSSPDKLRRRLKLLFNAGLLGRPRSQVAAMLSGEGSRSMAYVLTRRSATLLGRDGIAARGCADDQKLHQLEHHLGITSFLVEAQVACRHSEHLDFVPFDELVTAAPQATQAAAEPDRWEVALRHRGSAVKLYLRPNGIFAVRHRLLAAQGKPACKYFFFENDRSTMPLVRPELTKTSILRKMLTYGATFREGLHTSRFGMHNMRVLFLTESPQRVVNMVDAYQKHAAAVASPRLFLFTDRASLTTAPSFFDAVWLDGEGKEHTLFS
jgi:hypothetical protein